MLDPTRHDSGFDDEDDEPSLESDPAPSHRSGGPRSSDGKSRSSKNSVTHGCRSNILILHDEKQQDLDALYDRWQQAYQPDSEAALELLEQFILNKWYLLRNERRFNQVEYQLSFFEYTKWNEGQHRIFQLTLRYKTAAERAASKSQRELEDYLKNRRAEEKNTQLRHDRERTLTFQAQKDLERRQDELEHTLQTADTKGIDVSAAKADLVTLSAHHREAFARIRENLSALATKQPPAFLLFDGQNSPKKLRGGNILEQRVEITVKDGVTLTHLTPSNAELIERGCTQNPPPELIYRRLHFPEGVPDEYAWTTTDPLLRDDNSFGVQRLTVDTWLDLIAAEALRPGSHIGPCPASFTRLNPSADCACPACLHTLERLQQQASEFLKT